MMHQCCPCGDIILADTEDWEIPLCNECYFRVGEEEPTISIRLKLYRGTNYDHDHYISIKNPVKVTFVREFGDK